jgi:hypothetical protein
MGGELPFLNNLTCPYGVSSPKLRLENFEKIDFAKEFD